ncbi:MAG: type II toxin-antitoxin system VapC family toxin [Janthinobacterium lividum]
MKINWSPFVFIDTAGWIALLSPKDGLHSQAILVRNDLRQRHVRLITSEFVLIEVADAFSEPPLRSVAFEFYRGLRQNNTPFAVEIVPVSEDLLAKGWDLYRQRTDKGWGLTDCTSFVIMKEQGIIEAFTSDHHYTQAGFTVLLSR